LSGRTYARVYHDLVDDPKFSRVYGNDAAFGTWLRMLLLADTMYPSSAPLPRSNSSVRLLIEVGLIQERPGNRYIVSGLEAERERRSTIGRNAVAVRWNNERNANDVLAEQSRTEQNKAGSGANARNGARPDTFMGWKGKGLHDGRHGPECAVCLPLVKS
jgi:hypothetical protein